MKNYGAPFQPGAWNTLSLEQIHGQLKAYLLKSMTLFG
jgi:hypothetical protein